MSVARLMQQAAAGSAGSGPEPEVVGIENTVSSSGTTPSITLPSGISSGDVIVIFVGVDGTPTASITGFSQDIAAVGGWAASATYYVFSKTADGTEGSSVTLTLSASEVVCASAWVVTNADDISFSTTATSTGSVTPDSPSLTTVPTLWLSSFATDNGTPTITSYPSGYENGQSLSGGSNFGSPRLGVASKLQTSASEDPPEYTISISHNWVAVTVAIAAAAPAEWTDPDLANASYDSVSFSVAGQEILPTGVFFKSDGTSLYVVGQDSDYVYQYALSTAWDVSSASYASKSFSFSSQESNPQGVFFKPDGAKMYAIGFNNTVYQYSLSTAWDVSSASYDAISASAKGQFFSRGVFFKPDGTNFYVIGNGRDAVDQYSLSTAWDISTATDDNVSFSVLTQDGQPQSVYFNPDGTNCYVLGSSQSTDAVYKYTLSTAWDLTTASYSSISFSVASQDTAATGFFFKSDGSKMYVLGQGNDSIYQYST